jgi:flagellar biosynthesis anti-sigma factor FlgM
MKIQGTHPLYRLQSSSSTRSDDRVKQSSNNKDGVSLSGEAQWLSELKEAVESIPDVRVGEVQQAKADIASGEIGSESDLENAVNALFHEI